MTMYSHTHGRPQRRIVLVLAAVAVFAGALSAEARAAKRPNILFAMADDWCWPHAGAYGDKVVKTPTFDRLAREGVLFEYAYISSPSCTPCRNSIITGQQFYRLGQGGNLWSTLDPRHPNFMFLLRESGYQIGHWRKAWGPGNYKLGGYKEHPCGPQSKFDDFLKRRDKSKPFCFWFGSSDPHRPYKKDSGRKSGIDISAVHVPGFWPKNDTVRGDIADYYYEVQRWDRDVAAALKLLEQAGELDNTVIVMTGDNGMPFPRCKGNLYDWGSRAPLAVRWGKGVKKPRTVAGFVSLTDLAPTFLELAGVKIPAAMTGKSFASVLTGQSPAVPRDFVVYGRERHVPAQKMPSMAGYPSRAIRTEKWMLILNLKPDRWPAGVPTGATHPMNVFADCDNSPTKSFLIQHKADPDVSKYYDLCFAKRPAVELYDCKADPYQIHNLAGEARYANTVKALRKQLTEYLVATKDPRFTDAPVKFDEYPYQGGYLDKYLKKHGYK